MFNQDKLIVQFEATMEWLIWNLAQGESLRWHYPMESCAYCGQPAYPAELEGVTLYTPGTPDSPAEYEEVNLCCACVHKFMVPRYREDI